MNKLRRPACCICCQQWCIIHLQLVNRVALKLNVPTTVKLNQKVTNLWHWVGEIGQSLYLPCVKGWPPPLVHTPLQLICGVEDVISKGKFVGWGDDSVGKNTYQSSMGLSLPISRHHGKAGLVAQTSVAPGPLDWRQRQENTLYPVCVSTTLTYTQKSNKVALSQMNWRWGSIPSVSSTSTQRDTHTGICVISSIKSDRGV